MALQTVLQGVHVDVSIPVTRLAGEPENFVDIEFISLRFRHRIRPGVFVEFLGDSIKIEENVLSLTITDTSTILMSTGEYMLDLLYRKTNVLRPNNYEPFRLIKPVFEVVSESSKLNNTVDTELNIQSIVIQGEINLPKDGINGASAFDIWKAYYGEETSTIDDYFAWIHLPVNEAASDFDLLVASFNEFSTLSKAEEQNRITNETERGVREGTRIVDEQLRKTSEIGRETKEGIRNDNEGIREQNEADRTELFNQSIEESVAAIAAATAAANAQNSYNVTTAIPLASGTYYTKATARAAIPTASRKLGLVNTFALSAILWYTEKYIGSTLAGWAIESNWEQVPDKLRVDTLESNLKSTELPISEALNMLYNKIVALERLVSSGIFGSIQAESIDIIKDLKYRGAPLVIEGTAAPAIVPEFIGQKYINTSGAGVVYEAKGITSVSDWKQTSN